MIGIATSSTSTTYNFAKGKTLRQSINNGRSIKRKKVKPIVGDDVIVEEDNTTTSGNKVVHHQRASKRDWNIRGWIRVYCGPYRDVIDLEEASRMMNIASKATASDVVRDMDLPQDYSLWVRNEVWSK